MRDKTRCGFVAIIGRPNVGKSTLLNYLIGQKISIISRKPQTTRHRILGIKTINHNQIIYVDTPGIHPHGNRPLNRYMNKTAVGAIADVDVIVFMISGLTWKKDDEWVLKKLQSINKPIILVINKIDQIKDKSLLLPHIQSLEKRRQFAAIIPMSAKKGINVNDLEKTLIEYLPQGAWHFPADQITDRNERFLAAEIVREKLTRLLGQEVPYSLTVDIEQFQLDKSLLRIAAIIYVDKPGQKPIVVGDHGSRLKEVGTKARLDMEKLFEHKVFLQLWVKVKSGWADNEKNLYKYGYD